MMFKKKKKQKRMSAEDLGRLHKLQLDAAKAKFEVLEFSSENNDGSIQVIATGKRVLKSITLAPELLNQEKEQLQDTIVNVVNDALFKVREANIQLTTEVNRVFMNQVEELKIIGKI